MEEGEGASNTTPSSSASTSASSSSSSEEEEDDDEEEELDPDHATLLSSTAPLLRSRNAGVVVAVATLFHYLAPRSQVLTPCMREREGGKESERETERGRDARAHADRERERDRE